jgi:hypothetical protein
MIRLLFFGFCFLVFNLSSFGEGFYDLKPNDQYKDQSISLDYMPFHNSKTITYVEQNGSVILTYKYNNSIRQGFAKYRGQTLNTNRPEKYGTLEKFFVLYNPELDHNYDTYWPLNAKIGDTWKGEIYFFNVEAKLAEFGDMVYNNEKVQYAKITYVDQTTEKEGYAIFGKGIGLIEFNLDYRYLRLKPNN